MLSIYYVKQTIKETDVPEPLNTLMMDRKCKINEVHTFVYITETNVHVSTFHVNVISPVQTIVIILFKREHATTDALTP